MEDFVFNPHVVRIELDKLTAERDESGNYYLLTNLDGSKHIVEHRSIEYLIQPDPDSNIVDVICNGLQRFKNTSGISRITLR